MAMESINWFGKQGFGFIVDNEEQEVFFHISNRAAVLPPPHGYIASDQYAGDYDPVTPFSTHVSLQPELWTGCLPIKWVTVTPLPQPAIGNMKRKVIEHQTYDIPDYLPRLDAYLNNPSRAAFVRRTREFVYSKRGL